MNYKIFIDYDDNSLSTISNNLFNLLKENNIDVSILNNNLSLNDKINLIKNSSSKNLVISNKINYNDSNYIELIYPLRSTDELVRSIDNKIPNQISKYYQLRSNNNTILDYYEILRNINNNEALIIKYGQNTINNNTINLIYQGIIDYIQKANVYTVKSGDSLYAIARRFNTSVDDIKRLNNLTSNNLSIGQKLIIPENNISNIIDNPSNSQDNIYTVKSGDSLYAIARRFNTSVDDIKRLNNLTSNNLSIGQKLIIPENNISNIIDNPSNSQDSIYTVKSGDSLYAIARRFNTSVDDIKRLNNLSSNNLSIGQKLIISNNNINNNQDNIYTVKSGDSLYAIARRFNTSVDDIKRLNNLTSNSLSINQKLIIPK